MHVHSDRCAHAPGTPLFRSFAAWLIVAAVGSTAAQAAHRPKWATLDGGAAWNVAVNNCESNCASKTGDPVTVCPGESFSISYRVQITSSTDWLYTGYTIEGASEVCVNTPNHTGNGTFTETFNATAPLIPGTYDLTLDADGNNSCSSPSGGNLILLNAIIVLPSSAQACCVPSSGNDATCDGIDDDCDGETDEDAANCVLCGDVVDACIYIMVDRTGSTDSSSLADERDAAKDFLTALGGIALPPPVAIGTFGCNGSGFPANGSGHLGYCSGNADDACTLESLNNTESPAPYGDDDGSTSDGDHYAHIQRATASQSSTGTHFACALDVVNTELGHGSCPEGKEKILIFLSDGGDQDSQANTLNAANHLKDIHGIEVFTILFPPSGGATLADQQRMEDIASEPKNDHYFFAPTSSALEGILDAIASQITCDDGNPCTTDVCGESGVCEFTPKSVGTSCTTDSDLCTIEHCNGSGTCVLQSTVSCPAPIGPCDAGSVCNSATGACDALPDPAAGTPCDRDSDLCTTDQCNGTGTCVFVSNVSCPAPSGPCDSGSMCNPATGACIPITDPAAGTSCENDGNLCTLEECNGSGSCVSAGSVSCPGPDGPCDGGESCNPATGNCAANADPPLGTACERDGDLCTLDHCNGSGTCVTHDNVSCPGSTGTCDSGQSCNVNTGLCQHNPDPPAGTTCEADSNLCTVDQCNGTGSCITQSTVSCPGSTGTCDAGTACTPATGACDPLPDPPSGTTCDEDSNLCTVEECDGAGSCVFDHTVSCPGPTGECDGGQSCNPATGACVDNADDAAGSPCNEDGTLCTIDQCDGAGACVNQSTVSCPGSTGTCDAGTACTPATGACDPLPDPAAGTSCEADGNLCTIDQCNGSGSCTQTGSVGCPGPTGVCDAGQTCNPATGACQHNTDPAAGTPCNEDGSLCTIDECDGSGACVNADNVSCPGPTGECDAGTACTPATGACDPLPDPAQGTTCERDGDLCTHDHCDGSGSCITHDNVVCAGSTGPCDAGENCNPSTGQCQANPDPPLATPCEVDGNMCSIEACDGNGNCIHVNDVSCPGPTGTCDGGTACTPATGACDPVSDPAAGTSCEADGNLCTIDECDGLGSCVTANHVSCPGPTATCDGGTACTPATGACDPLPETPAGTACEADGDLCTIDECNGQGTCITDSHVSCPGPTGVCDGGTACTPATGACDPLPETPQGTTCEADGNLCTIDSCDGQGSCVNDIQLACPGPSGPCDGGTACTPATGTCDPLPETSQGFPCEADGNLCTIDHCDGTGACVTHDNVVCPGPTGVCDGGTACTPATGACDPLPETALGTSCEADGNLCTIDECDGSGSCVTDDHVSCPGPTGVCDGGTACAPATGLCMPVADPPLSTECDADGNLCTVDHCDGQGQCVLLSHVICPGPKGECDGGTACTPATGACDPLPDPPTTTPCERDGDLCTIDRCDGMGACVFDSNVTCPAMPGQCDNGYLCSPSTGECDVLVPLPNTTFCERDGNLCTIDKCDGMGGCVNVDSVYCPEPEHVCDGGTMCTPSTGACDPLPHPPAGGECELDSSLCTIDECDGNGACVTVEEVQCDGPMGDCDHGTMCNPMTGACDDLPDPVSGTSCERDSDLCTIDTCDGLGNCLTVDDIICPGSTGDCDAGQNCEPTSGMCVNLPDPPLGSVCEQDQNQCTIEKCDGAGNCVVDSQVQCPAPTKACDGGTACTPATGACDPLPDTPMGTSCERDGNLCTLDVCNGTGTCVKSGNVSCPGPAHACDGGTMCNPASGNCDALPDPPLSTPCSADSNECTQDHCNGQGACVNFGNVSCLGPTKLCDGGTACTPATGVCDPLPDPPSSTVCEADGSNCTQDRCNGNGSCVQVTVICGACCNTLTGVCNENKMQSQCTCSHCVWTQGVSCSQAGCIEDLGACCERSSTDMTVAVCFQSTQAQCACERCSWSKGLECDQIMCDPNFVPIPTVSEWGLVVLALFLLIGGKVYFGRRTALA